MAVLELRGVSVRYQKIPLLHDVSLTVEAGERLGITGESGAGKTLTALAMMGLLPWSLTVAGQVVRGGSAAMVFADPLSALNPTMRAGKQIAEATGLRRRQAAAKALDLMRRVEFTDPDEQFRRYPHQLSGGQRQRVLLAMAIARDPAVIVADEPATALDVTVREEMLGLLSRLAGQQRSALVLISRDLAVVSGTCERVVVMYGGRIVEQGTTAQVLARPRHRYTAALAAASPIPGRVPPAGAFPAGCPFRNRCAHAREPCELVPPLLPLDDHLVACWNPASPSP